MGTYSRLRLLSSIARTLSWLNWLTSCGWAREGAKTSSGRKQLSIARSVFGRGGPPAVGCSLGACPYTATTAKLDSRAKTEKRRCMLSRLEKRRNGAWKRLLLGSEIHLNRLNERHLPI